MKLQRLDLIAFGHFTNRTIDFYGPDATPSEASPYGVHVIYGPNEAGKSSSLRALTAWLFGFPARTDDDFLHSYQNLRVGGLLVNRDGETLACIRRKGNNNTLRDHEDSAVLPPESLAKFLPKLDEKQFLRMFGIDHDTLREGGEELARGGGESGQALFASASGLNNLTHSQQNLEASLEAILSRSGRKGKLLEKIKHFEKLTKEEREAELTLEEWTRLDQDVQEASKKYNNLKKQLDEKRLRYITLDRYQAALPTVNKTVEKTAEIQRLGPFPPTLESFAEFQSFESALDQTLQDLTTIRTNLKNLESEQETLEEDLKKIPKTDWKSDFEKQVSDVIAGLGVYLQAKKALPAIELRRNTNQHQLEQIWEELGQLDGLRSRLDAARFPSHEKKRIEQLARQYDEQHRSIRTLEDQLAKHKARIDRNEAEESPPIDPLVIASVERIEKQCNLEVDKQRETRELVEHIQVLRRSIDTQLERLNLASGTIAPAAIAELAKRPVPAIPTIERWAKEEDKLTEQITKSQQSCDELERKYNAKKRSVEREIDKANLPTYEDWTAAKTARDAAFDSLVQANPDSLPGTKRTSANGIAAQGIAAQGIDAYRELQTQADRIADDLLTHAERVAQREKLLESLEEFQQEIDSEGQKRLREKAAFEDWTSRWNQFTTTHSLPSAPPETVIAWVHSLTDTQRLALDYINKEAQRVRSEESLQQCIHDAQQCLRSLGMEINPTISAEQTLGLVNHWLEQARKQRAEKEAFAKQRVQELEEYQSLQIDHKIASSRFDELQKQWWEALTSLAIPTDATPEQTQQILSQISDLQSLTDTLATLEQELEANRAQVAGYESQVAQLLSQQSDAVSATMLATGQFQASQTEQIVRELELAKSTADTNKTIRAGLIDQLQKNKQRLGDAECERKELEHDLAKMMQAVGATTQDDLRDIARRSRQLHQLEVQRSELRNLLYQSCDGQDIDAFIDKIRSLNPDDMTLERDELQHSIGDLEIGVTEALKHQTKLQEQQRQLDTSGRASQLATEARGVATEIEECVQELAILRMASAALVAGIERYRQANEDPILKRASEMYRALTLERYQAIEIDIEESGKHILVGRRSENGNPVRVTIEKMSDGTRDQFFLALRLASIEQWNASHDPVPLIVDDILVHFDDRRAAATLDQLAKLSEKTQVIFFTHHQHLVELAKSTVPQDLLFVHKL